MEKREIFKNNLKEASFTEEFIKQALNYFNEVEKEGEIQGLTVEDTLHYFNRINFTCNAQQSLNNLQSHREDLARLYRWDSNNILEYSNYFEDIEEFELQVLYVLFYEFYPQEEEEINWDE